MSVEEEVMNLRKQLEKCTPGGEGAPADGGPDPSLNPLDLLQALSKLEMNLNILTTTRIGMTVNALRKSSKEDEVITLAKSLIKTWKKFVPESAEKKEKKKEEKKEEAEKNGGKSKEEPNASFPQRPQATADEVRLRCRDMLTKALRGEGELPDGVSKPCDELAELIEDCLFAKFRGTDTKYKNQIRSRVFNLRDKKNPELRENVLCGVIEPEKFAFMKSDEMASEDIKKQRALFVKQGIDNSRLASVEGTKTALLKCGKCGKRNCTYNQIQTRSADEPMTTFVLCMECGNRWKFC